MRKFVKLFLVLLFAGLSNTVVNGAAAEDKGLTIQFESIESYSFSAEEKSLITDIITTAENEVRVLRPALAENLMVIVVPLERDLSLFGGVTGRTDAPGVVIVELSPDFPGGITAAANTGLRSNMFHEFHHEARGWTINDNKFPFGISIAMVNEGLAEYFSVEYTGFKSDSTNYPENIEDWVAEIMALPDNANYGHWMFRHPDGRQGIGYKAGYYLISKVVASSGKSILELSEMSPDEIFELAGLK